MDVFHIDIVDNNRIWNYYDKAEQKIVNFITKVKIITNYRKNYKIHYKHISRGHYE
jgi:hypothetical protein